MTVLSRGARARRGGRRPGWVLLTALLVLAMGASSALVFTNRVELLKLAVILALWAAVAGAFVSVLYRRQSDIDQSKARDLKLVYDLQLDREISARREYELTVESQLRRELASELRAAAADEVAALRAELAALRTQLEILFDTDLEHRPALETLEPESARPAGGRAYGDWERNGESVPADWVNSDRVTSVRRDPSPGPAVRPDETSIIDVPEEPLLAPRPPRERERARYEARFESAYGAAQFQEPYEPPFVAPPQGPQIVPPQVVDPFIPPPPVPQMPPPPVPDPRFEPRHRSQPAPQPTLQPLASPQPEPLSQGAQPQDRQPISHWSGPGAVDSPDPPPGGRPRARHQYAPQEALEEASSYDSGSDQPQPEPPASFGEQGRRSRSRHSAEYRDYSVSNLISRDEQMPGTDFQPAPPTAAPAPPPASGLPPKLAPPLPPEPTPRHRSGESQDSSDSHAGDNGGQSVADLLARFDVQPTAGGRRRRRDA